MKVLLAICLSCATLTAQENGGTTKAPAAQGWTACNDTRPGFLLFSASCGGDVPARVADSAISPFALGLPDFDDGSSATAGAPQSSTPRPKAITYSDGYYVRRKVHVYASFATLPLFVAESIVGQKLYNQTTPGSLRSAHSALAGGIGVLFGVNTVTGVWNMWDARKDPNGHTKRMVHGILMLTADAGFVATAALAPGGGRGGLQPTGDPSLHRGVAIGSMAVATAGYLYMLLKR